METPTTGGEEGGVLLSPLSMATGGGRSGRFEVGPESSSLSEGGAEGEEGDSQRSFSKVGTVVVSHHYARKFSPYLCVLIAFRNGAYVSGPKVVPLRTCDTLTLMIPSSLST